MVYRIVKPLHLKVYKSKIDTHSKIKATNCNKTIAKYRRKYKQLHILDKVLTAMRRLFRHD